MRTVALLAIASLLVLVCGCVQNNNTYHGTSGISNVTNETDNVTNTTILFGEKNATASCEKICNESLKNGVDLSSGPCLSQNNTNWDVADWVCDVVHVPRQGIDDLNENQCTALRVGQAHHFVEVDTNCKFVDAY